MEVGHCYLDGNADAVEFCPHESYYRVLAAATYTLHEGEQQSRSGSISLFDVDAEVGRFELCHRVKTVGIFDVKWSPVEGNMVGQTPMLAQADADGSLRVHGLHNSLGDEKGYCLREINVNKISSSMCLCLDWNPSASSISVGLSDGSVSVVAFSESKLNVIKEWQAHDFELWTTAFDIHQPQLVYTGSDDCKFSCWDLRDSASNLVFQNSKVHKMGVCCIAKTPIDAHTILTGSYDEYLRVWDIRSISKPVNETSICLGGGVWRIKYHPYEPGFVLAACMHNGFAIVRIKQQECELVESYTKHGSLAYGADWQRAKLLNGDKQKGPVVATCSFYDRLLRIWMPENNIFQ
ncbi:hypothetical protein K2173_022730 [Erythroxylum novogranatense]|uniref:methylated diphthine methylhydrolase n=1 Tax=Erythroxylum novogranatense TaxID=1862640 RepID=A0AAV8SNF3_9ROSI|nr:hypothetical protein K2173_022730 [Erythroxylum novogranatense]